MTAIATSLTGIGRIKHHDRDARQFRFVVDKLQQLMERPIMQIATLFTSSPYPFADAFEIFKSDTASGALRYFYNQLTDRMIQPRCKEPLSTRQSFSDTICRFRSFLLKASTLTKTTIANIQKLRATILLAIRIGCNIYNTHINTKILADVHFVWCFNLTRNKKIKLTINIAQVTLTTISLKKLMMSVATQITHPLTTIHCPDRYGLFSNLETQDTSVVGKSPMGFEFSEGSFVQLIGMSDFGNGAYCHLCRETKPFANIVIDDSMQIELTEYLMFPSFLTSIITSSVSYLKRFKQEFILFSRWLKFDLSYKSYHHIELYHKRR